MNECPRGCGEIVKPRGLNNHLRAHLRFDFIRDTHTPDECWLWTGAVNEHRGGYGQTRLLGEVYAHRASYRLWKGDIPSGWQIDHLCRTPRCINPAHLETVPQLVNWERGQSVTRQHALQETCVNGHPFDSENTYRWRGSRVCRACNRAHAARYARKVAAA